MNKCRRPTWRPDGRCGANFPVSPGEPGQCYPQANANEKGPCCSPLGWCGNSAAHCDCPTCIDYSTAWRPDGRCGANFPAPSGEPGQCDPEANANEKGPCCSSLGWCGNSAAHCDCPTCIDYSAAWRPDGRCGANFPAPSGEPGQCD